MCQFPLYSSDPVIHIYTFFFLYYLPSCSIPREWIQLPVLYHRTSLLIHSKCSSLQVLTPNFPSIPPEKIIIWIYFPREVEIWDKSGFQIGDSCARSLSQKCSQGKSTGKEKLSPSVVLELLGVLSVLIPWGTLEWKLCLRDCLKTWWGNWAFTLLPRPVMCWGCPQENVKQLKKWPLWLQGVLPWDSQAHWSCG